MFPGISIKYVDGTLKRMELYRYPSELHAHLRLGALLQAVVPYILRGREYVLVMPNNGTDEGGIIRTIRTALRYREVILAFAKMHPGCEHVKLVMTLYLTSAITPKVLHTLARIRERYGIHFCIKYYPPEQGGTTNSGHGIPLSQCIEVLRVMAELSIPLVGHFESVKDRAGRTLEHKDRETYFMDNEFIELRDNHPSLKITIEHGSTIEAINWVKKDPTYTAMSVTPWHPLFNNSVFGGPGANHFKCMPILKDEEHRAALCEFVTSGAKNVYAGGDLAPHLAKTKSGTLEDASSGSFSKDPLGMYADAYVREGKLGDGINFMHFACLNGPRFLGLPEPEYREKPLILIPRGGVQDEPIPVEGTDDFVIPIGYIDSKSAVYRTPFIQQVLF